MLKSFAKKRAMGTDATRFWPVHRKNLTKTALQFYFPFLFTISLIIKTLIIEINKHFLTHLFYAFSEKNRRKWPQNFCSFNFL